MVAARQSPKLGAIPPTFLEFDNGVTERPIHERGDSIAEAEVDEEENRGHDEEAVQQADISNGRHAIPFIPLAQLPQVVLQWSQTDDVHHQAEDKPELKDDIPEIVLPIFSSNRPGTPIRADSDDKVEHQSCKIATGATRGHAESHAANNEQPLRHPLLNIHLVPIAKLVAPL